MESVGLVAVVVFFLYKIHERRKSIAFRTNKEASRATKGTAGLNLPTGLTLQLIYDLIARLFICSSLSELISTLFFERNG